MVANVGGSIDMRCASYLHDTLGDTNTTVEELLSEFGESITNLVIELTNVTTLSDGNRKNRNLIDSDRISKISNDEKTIKIADCIDNCESIQIYDPKFAKVYFE